MQFDRTAKAVLRRVLFPALCSTRIQIFPHVSRKYGTKALAAAAGLLYEISDAAIRKWLVLAGALAPPRRLGADLSGQARPDPVWLQPAGGRPCAAGRLHVLLPQPAGLFAHEPHAAPGARANLSRF